MSAENMSRFYYTFGTAETFPFQKGWVEVKAKDRIQANTLFRQHFPDRTPGVMNCSCTYSEEHFQTIQCMANNFNDWKICHAVVSVDGIEIMEPKQSHEPKKLANLLADAKAKAQAIVVNPTYKHMHDPARQ